MQLALSPPGNVSLGRFRGTPQTIKLMKEYAIGNEGERSFMVRQAAEAIVRHISPKDYLSEILALYGWVRSPALRYTNDALHVEQVKSPQRILMEVATMGASLVDCDDLATLVAAMALTLGRRPQFVIVGFGAPGVYTHVFVRILEPRSKEWIIVDPVAGSRDAEMARRAKHYDIIEVE
jgi:hypothetical protein